MKNASPQVDAYIVKAAPFAQPIIRKVRALFHKACPVIEEKIKWGAPSFEHKGMVGGVAAFKNHASFGFWRQDALPDPLNLFRGSGFVASGKITDVSQLPPDKVLLTYIRNAVRLNEEGPPPRKKGKPKPPPKAPPDFLAALRKNRKALATFDSFPPSQKREYIDWITEAKRPETRITRLATSIQWLSEGKRRNWKYMNC